MPNAPERPDPGRLVQAALDVFVYAPIGAALEARDRLPQLAERGRNQVTLVRLFGRYAMRRGRSEADRILALRPDAPGKTGTRGTATTARRPGPGPATPPPVPNREAAAEGPATPAPAAVELPIPGYDSLSASQVLPRLSALGPDELEAVRRYEEEHRGRRTILNRITQLHQG